MAKDKIQGLIIEIGGDTTDLSKALKKPNSDIKDLNSKLNAVNQALKFDPENTDLLSQRQRLLGEAVDENKKKLELLKNAQKQFVASGKDVDSAQYIELERQIAQTENRISQLKNEQNSFSKSLKEMSKSVNDFGVKVENTGKKMSVLSAGIVAVGAGSMAAWSEIDEGLDNIAKGTGATGEALEDLQGSFDKVYGSMPTTVENASNAIADINTRFGFTGEELEKASEAFIKFAEVNNTDVSTAVANVSRAMGDASIDSKEYSSVLDALTAASQASGISIDKLTENITKYGAPMRALGYDTQESIAIFASWEKAGVNTEIAFSGMKKAISTFSAEGKDAKKEFAKVLEEIEKCPDIASATTKAIEVFGTKAGPDLADAIQQGRFSFEDMMNVVQKSGGQLAQTYEDTLDPVDKATVAMNNAKLAGAELGNTIQVMLTPFLEKITIVIQNLTTRFKNLSPEMQNMIVIIAAIVASIGPALIIFGKVAQSISSITTLFSTLGIKVGPIMTGIKTAFTTCFNAILAHPIIAGIAAIIAIIVLLYTKCDWFRDGVNNIISNVISYLQNLKIKAINAFNNIVDGIKNLPSKMLSIGTNLVKGLWDGINNTKQWILNKISGFTDGIVTGIKGFFGISSPSKVMEDEVGEFLPAGLGKGITKNEDLALTPLQKLQKKMTNSFNPDVFAEVNKSLSYSNSITINVPIETKLDGKVVSKNFVTRITNVQGVRNQFKGAY